MPEELIDAFSGRDREIETRLAAIIDEEERRTGHTIGWKRRAELHKQVWLETRKPKTDARPGLAELTRRWHGKLRAEAPGTSIDATVGIGQIPQGFGIEVQLEVSIPGMDKAAAQALVDKAHQVCPYSNATRGNIDVTITVV
mgnify:CR=1 FL=1